MKSEVLTRIQAHPKGKVRIVGRVAGIEACELVSDMDEIVVGSAVDCDLVVADALLPARTFRLRREKCHAGTDEECRCMWMLEALPGARVYVNQRLVRREKMAYGDTISAGCHHFVFTKVDNTPRNLRLNQNVGDLCARLLARHPAPQGFLRNTPLHQYLQRRRTAISWVALLVLLIATLSLLAPREQKWEEVQPPLDVSVVEQPRVAPDAVRSLAQANRQKIETAETLPDEADLASRPPAPAGDVRAMPVVEDRSIRPVAPASLTPQPVDPGRISPATLAALAPVPLNVERMSVKLDASTALQRQDVKETSLVADDARIKGYQTMVDDMKVATRTMAAKFEPVRPVVQNGQFAATTAWQLPARAPVAVEAGTHAIKRTTPGILPGGLPARRLSMAEAAQVVQAGGELAGYKVTIDAKSPQAAALIPSTADLKASMQKPAATALNSDPSKTLGQLAAYKPSPVTFEEFRGLKVPVARIAEQLGQLEVKPGIPKTMTIDGVVTPSEISASWKSGRFRTHAPGSPVADPATYCYVNKTDVNGKPCLYISFVCMDPDTSKIIAGSSSRENDIVQDDSVEIFLDTNFDRRDYHQLIVNARGTCWAAYYVAPAFADMNKPTLPRPWNVAPSIKTTINREAGQWACEIVIPFDYLGGVPAKGSRWAVNFCRNFRGQKADWQLQTWFVVYSQVRNFHHPNLFGVFEW